MTSDFAACMEAVAQAIRDLARALAEAFRRAMQEIQRLLGGLRVPAAPLARPTLPRPPARLDPPGGLRPRALGRPAYRPAR